MKLTEQDIEDLEAVVSLAISSEYMDSTNDKACYRVEDLIKKLKEAKAAKNRDMKDKIAQIISEGIEWGSSPETMAEEILKLNVLFEELGNI
jgi:KaiC/GvpD/RAD55 family RecA-like ATPase